MGREYRAKVFKSGNSVALRLPKALGVVEGTEMIVREEDGRFSFAPLPEAKRRIDLSGIYGSCPQLKPLTPADREIDPRPLDWEGARLNRD